MARRFDNKFKKKIKRNDFCAKFHDFNSLLCLLYSKKVLKNKTNVKYLPKFSGIVSSKSLAESKYQHMRVKVAKSSFVGEHLEFSFYLVFQ